MAIKDKIILLIDDDLSIHALVEKILTNAGIKFFCAQNGQDGYDMIAKNPPHLILLDIDLNESLNGIDILKKIRANPKFQQISVVMFSSRNDRITISRSFKEGANDYLEKPVNASHLLQKIRKNIKDIPKVEFYFLPNEENFVSAKLVGEVTKISEMGIEVKTKIKFSTGENIECDSPLFKKIKHHQNKFLVSGNAQAYEAGEFINRFNFRAISEEALSQIRKHEFAKKEKK